MAQCSLCYCNYFFCLSDDSNLAEKGGNMVTDDVTFDLCLCDGNYMEPDLKYGRGMLEALKAGIEESK